MDWIDEIHDELRAAGYILAHELGTINNAVESAIGRELTYGEFSWILYNLIFKVVN